MAPYGRKYKVPTNKHKSVEAARISQNTLRSSLEYFSLQSEDQWFFAWLAKTSEDQGSIGRYSSSRVFFHCLCGSTYTLFKHLMPSQASALLLQNITCLLVCLLQQNIFSQVSFQKNTTWCNYVSNETRNVHLRADLISLKTLLLKSNSKYLKILSYFVEII